MPKRGELTHDVLDRIWASEILPLLEEHHYGEGKDVLKQYRIDTLRAERSAMENSVPKDTTGESATPAEAE